MVRKKSKELVKRTVDMDNLARIMREPGWNVLKDKFKEQIQNYKNKLVETNTNRISDIRGYQKAIEALTNLWKDINNVLDEGEEALKIMREDEEEF